MISAIVPAAGSGSRMQSAVPKQYLPLGGKTVLEQTVAVLLRAPAITEIIIVVSPTDPHPRPAALAAHPRVRFLAQGGAQRAESVLAGLYAAGEARWALVHDAARPCLHQEDLRRLLALTETSTTGGILAAPVRDTMKRAVAGTQRIARTVCREDLWHALTPQLFPRDLLLTCLERVLREHGTVTDEASALEYCGWQPELVPGRADNIKITRPEDLLLAEFYLTQRARAEGEQA